jgi:hypothetical protein
MTEVWKFDNEYYCIYTQNKKVMKRIKLSFHDFIFMADYFNNDNLIGIQYKVQVKRK